MNAMSRFANGALKLLFGAWNGIQVFVYPALIFYWLDSLSLVQWFSGLLSEKNHQLPFTLFLLTCIYMAFLIFKFYSFVPPSVSKAQRTKDFVRFLLELHKGLFLVLFVAIMIYVLSSFLKYFYNISMPLRLIYARLFQYLSLALILFYYIQHVWTSPFRKRGQSMKRAIDHVMAYSRRNPGSVLKYTFLIVLVILISVRLYLILVNLAINPLLSYLGLLAGDGIKLKLIYSSNSVELLINACVIMLAFLLSNLLFSPLVYLGTRLLNNLHPIKVKVPHAQTTQNNQEV